MKLIKNIISIVLLMPLFFLFSCDKDFEEINRNIDQAEPNVSDPNLLMTTVMAGIATSTTAYGYADFTGSGVQYVQKDAWDNNRYNWSTENTIWTNNYRYLNTNKLAYDRAVKLGLRFHQGVTLILKSMLFGTLADYYGDIPYSDALKGADEKYEKPAYDSQETVYKGVLADLEKASKLLGEGDFEGIIPLQDIFYNGDASKWQRLANSLALRYYIRLSKKIPDFAHAGVVSTLKKPLIDNVKDALVLNYTGTVVEQSWPSCGKFGGDASDFTRIKPCTTLTDKLKDLKDPRIAVWFAPVKIPTKVVPAAEVPGGGRFGEKDGIRYFNKDSLGTKYAIYSADTYSANKMAGKMLIDTSSVYVGLPVAVTNSSPFTYNLNVNGARGSKNDYVSSMNELFNQKEDGGKLLKARLFSYAELCFLKAEAALLGWGTDAKGNYESGVRASFDDWGIGEKYDDYKNNTSVAFDGTLERIIEQKWIANMFNGNESYLDWRRTGFPVLKPGPFAIYDVMPLRFTYPSDEVNINTDNNAIGAASLEKTKYSNNSVNDSPYSKPWVIQGTNKPW